MKESTYSSLMKSMKVFFSALNLLALMVTITFNLAITPTVYAAGVPPVPYVQLASGTTNTDVKVRFLFPEGAPGAGSPIDLTADLDPGTLGIQNLWDTFGASMSTNYSGTDPAFPTNPVTVSKDVNNLDVNLSFSSPINAGDSFWVKVARPDWGSKLVLEGIPEGPDSPDDWSAPSGDDHQLSVDVAWADWVEQPIAITVWYGTEVIGSPDGFVILNGGPADNVPVYVPHSVETQVMVKAVWWDDGDMQTSPDLESDHVGPINISGAGPTDVGLELVDGGGGDGFSIELDSVNDTDATGYGLNGADFGISWVNNGEIPNIGSSRFLFFIVPSERNIEFTPGAICKDPFVGKNFTCAVSGCEDPLGDPMNCIVRDMLFPFEFSQLNEEYTFNNKVVRDSEGQLFDEIDYQVCIAYLNPPISTDVYCSGDLSPSSDDGQEDTQDPFILANGVNGFESGSSMKMYGRITDEKTTDFGGGLTPEEEQGYAILYYEYLNDGTPTITTSYATLVPGTKDLYEFSTVGGITSSVNYFIGLADMDDNFRFFTADGGFDTNPDNNEDDFEAASEFAFSISPKNAGSSTVEIDVRDGNGQVIDEAIVFSSNYGLSYQTVDTDVNDGIVTFEDLPNGSYNFWAMKDGYCDQKITLSVKDNTVEKHIILSEGVCPNVNDGMFNVVNSNPRMGQELPVGAPLMIWFNEEVEILTIDSGLALNDKAGGVVSKTFSFCSNSGDLDYGCNTYLKPNDNNVLLIIPDSPLDAFSQYSLIINNLLKSTDGQSLQGNIPSGGQEIIFRTGPETVENLEACGTGGQNNPPFVTGTLPGPGMKISSDSSIVVNFSDPLDTDTITTDNVLLTNSAGTPYDVDLDFDSSLKSIIVEPLVGLPAGNYNLVIKGGLTSATGLPVNCASSSSSAFTTNFMSSGVADSQSPKVYGSLGNLESIPVNQGVFKFTFSEPMNASTLSTDNISMSQGISSVSLSLNYDIKSNTLFVMPEELLLDSLSYSINFSSSVTDLAGNPVTDQNGESNPSFSFLTGTVDDVAPILKDAKCDDYACTFFFSEPMVHGSFGGSNWPDSVVNPDNFNITGYGEEIFGLDVDDLPITYDPTNFSVTVKGVNISNPDFIPGIEFAIVYEDNVTDMSGNEIGDQFNFQGTVKDSTQSSQENGVNGPFDKGEMVFGGGSTTRPFVNIAGLDSQVFQVKFNPNMAVVDGDRVVITFPEGTGVSSAKKDEFSPFASDFNADQSGIITFDTGFSDDGIDHNETTKRVTIALDVTGSVLTNNPLTIDLRGIINPVAPNNYKVNIKLIRDGVAVYDSDSSEYSIVAGGSNTFELLATVDGGEAISSIANGNMFIAGGGPAGPMDHQLTLASGQISEIDGAEADGILTYESLPDGCYFVNPQKFIQFGDYGFYADPINFCLRNGETVTKTVHLRPSDSVESKSLIVKMVDEDGDPFDFEGRDVDIFAGGPNGFFPLTLEDLTAMSIDPEGYEVPLASNGRWSVGIGPALPKGPSKNLLEPLPGNPPPPVEIIVQGLNDHVEDNESIRLGKIVPGSVELDYDEESDQYTLTITLSTLRYLIEGTVVDANDNTLSNINVMVHRKGFSAPSSTKTDGDGNFSIMVPEAGTYEIGASKPGSGLPSKFISINVVDETPNDEDYTASIFYRGTEVENLEIKLKKPPYYISGKVLDENGNAVAYAPIFASNDNGDLANGGTDGSGNYTLFVDEGTWDLVVQLPPSKTDSCADFSREVIVDGGNQINQNIIPEAVECVNVDGEILVDGSPAAYASITIIEVDEETNLPVPDGFVRQTKADENGVYEASVAPDATYDVSVLPVGESKFSETLNVEEDDISCSEEEGECASNIVSTNADLTFEFVGDEAILSEMSAFVSVTNTDTGVIEGENITGLDENLVISLPEGDYNYFVNIQGLPVFENIEDTPVSTGDTVVINLADYSFTTLTGVVNDSDGNPLPQAMVNFTNAETGKSESVLTDENGEYEMILETGPYTMGTFKDGYLMPIEPPVVEFAEATYEYSFGPGGNDDQDGLTQAEYSIDGTVNDPNGDPVKEGYVVATNDDTGITSVTPIESDGTYTLPIIDGNWTLSSFNPKYEETGLEEPVTIAAGDEGNVDLEFDTEIDENLAGTIYSETIDSDGGIINDSTNTGITLYADQGTFAGVGDGDVNVTFEVGSDAPETTTDGVLCNMNFVIEAESDAGTVKDVNNLQMAIDIEPLLEQCGGDLPEGVEEGDFYIGHWNENTQSYEKEQSSHSGGTLYANINSLSSFAIIFGHVAAQGGDEDNGDINDGDNNNSSGGIIRKLAKAGEESLPISSKFVDIENHWAKIYIEDLFSRHIVVGIDETHFTPQEVMTRAQFVKIVVKMFNLETTAGLTKTSFSDVKTSDWFAPYVEAAKTNGLVNGYTDGTFKPTAAITRAEAIKVLMKAIGASEMQDYKGTFNDVPKAAWFGPYVNYAAMNGIVNGYNDNSFKPGKFMTRAEVAKIVSIILSKGYQFVK